MRRPERIDQIIPSILEHDAVSSHTFEAQRILCSMGFSSTIYALTVGPGAEGRVEPLASLAQIGDGSQWVLYQSSIGSPAGEVFARHPGPKLLDYHNITPTDLVERWLPPLGEETRLGRRQLREYAPFVTFAMADSAYNKAELDEAGYRRTAIAPILVDSANLSAPSDPVAKTAMALEKREGGSDWLFVGQIAPHKAQHDIIKAFACYRQLFDHKARLHLVGREMGSTYIDAIHRFVGRLGLRDTVELPGSVSSEVLAAYFEAADVFVCLSDHEGFCAPLIEAMNRGVPVVAYGAAAVPGTVGDAGIVLEDKSSGLVASAVNRVLSDQVVRTALIRRGQQRAGIFTLENAREDFRRSISDALAVTDGEPSMLGDSPI